MINLIPFLAYVFVTAFTPGPNNIMSMTNANRYGLKRTMGFLVGIAAGFMVVMIICSYSNLLLYNVIPKIRTVMSLIGAGYMLYLAIKVISNNPHADPEDDKKLNSFSTGFIMQFVNIKGILYGVTAISSFILPYYNSNAALLVFSVFLTTVGFLGVLCWAVFGALFQSVISRNMRVFNVSMALLLVYSAVSIFHS